MEGLRAVSHTSIESNFDTAVTHGVRVNLNGKSLGTVWANDDGTFDACYTDMDTIEAIITPRRPRAHLALADLIAAKTGAADDD